VLLGACEQPQTVEEVIRPVRYEEVRAADREESRTYSGTTQAELEIDLSFRVGGRLDRRDVDVGDLVGPDDPVGELDPADYEARVQEALAGRDLARAGVTNAQADLERARRLYENDTVSQREYDAAIAAADSATAQLDAAGQQLSAARLQLGYTQLTAPQQCTVAATFAEINQNVTPGQPIVRLNCGQCAEVVVSVPEIDIGRISEGNDVRVTINALGGTPIAGFVREVGVDTGATGTTYPVTIGLLERCTELRAGMAAEVEFQLRSSGPSGALVVPFVAVGEDRDTGDNFVYVLEQEDDDIWTAHRRTVVLGGPTTIGLIVTEGINEGELIVTAGVRRLTADQRVRLLARDSSDELR
jgi:RND family efflux transporter MFP subunit